MACPIFQDAGFHGRLKSVPEDAEGIDIDYLRRGLGQAEETASKEGNDRPKFKKEKEGINRFYKHIIYCVPTFANPSAKTMSFRRRRELVEVAREYDALLVSDDVYDFLQWRIHSSSAAENFPQKALLPRLVDIDAAISGGTDRPGADGFGNAVSNASFSKIAGPGARCGWAEGTPKLAFGLSQVGATKSGGSPSQLTSTYITELLKDGTLQRHIRQNLQPAYQRRHKLMVDTIKEVLEPMGVVISEPAPKSYESIDDDATLSSSFPGYQNISSEIAGGYFLYLHLPAQMSAKALAARCNAEENLIIGGGPIFAVFGDEDAVDLRRYVRLCFSWEDEDKLVEGIKRMAKVVRRMLSSKDSGADPLQNGTETG
ncbi:MAG: hypothetical protein MMC23_004090 [Stictis urceolatum]|nr:hypothetical protein [Stictis urceolata]